MLRSTSKYLDIEVWNSQLAARGNQVCRIEILSGNDSPLYSTGFLIGPDVVITNFHNLYRYSSNSYEAIQRYIAEIDPSSITLRFDYKRSADGQTLDMGTECHLASNDWLVDYSPAYLPTIGLPQSEGLDYALLRVERDIGHEMISGNGPAIMRGWIELLEEEYRFSVGEPLLILQHPFGQPLKLAFGSDAVIGTSDDKVKINYNLSTQPGSSGSPCFNVDLDLVALHQGTDLRLQANQGINMHAILQLLIDRGHQDLVSKKVPRAENQSLEDNLMYTGRFPSDPSLKAIIDEGESEETEFKVGSIRDPHTGERNEKMRHKVIKAVAGFMNGFGGKVLIGITNDQKIVGIKEEYEIFSRNDWDSYALSLEKALNSNLSIRNPHLWYKIKRHQVEGKDICSISVLPADEPVYVQSSFFVRTGKQTQELPVQEHGHYILRRWSPK